MLTAVSTYFYSWRQLHEQYPNEYVLLVDPIWEFYNVPGFGGQLVYKNKSEKKVAQKVIDLPANQRFSIVYTGPFETEPNTVFVL